MSASTRSRRERPRAVGRRGRPRPSVAPSFPGLSIDYSFRQRFPVPAEKAFRWCVDYSPDDRALGGVGGTRNVTWLTSTTVLLEDTVPVSGGRPLHKTKLVHIYPKRRTWVNTHLSGPNHHSQFRYEIIPDGPNASVLLYQGRELRWTGIPRDATSTRALAKRLREEDAAMWKRFAAVMAHDLAGR